jgi:hypothetical protein
MDKRSFQRLIDGNDMFLIVRDEAVCKIENVTIELEGSFPLSMDNHLVRANISGTFTTGELDTKNYDESMNSMLVIDNLFTEFFIGIFRIVISDINNNAVRTLQGNTQYSYKANTMRMINSEGKDE